jgi:hypothetical protein
MNQDTKKKLLDAAKTAFGAFMEDGVVLAGAAATTAVDEILAERAPRAHEAVRRIREAHRNLEHARGQKDETT